MKKVISEKDKRFATAIERLMDAHGMSQIALAGKAKINPVTLNRILNLKQSAGDKASTALAGIFGVDPDDLYAKPHPRLSDLAKETIEPPPAPPTTFTLDEMRAAIRDEIQATLDVERLRLENERLKAELAALKSQLAAKNETKASDLSDTKRDLLDAITLIDDGLARQIFKMLQPLLGDKLKDRRGPT